MLVKGSACRDTRSIVTRCFHCLYHSSVKTLVLFNLRTSGNAITCRWYPLVFKRLSRMSSEIFFYYDLMIYFNLLAKRIQPSKKCFTETRAEEPHCQIGKVHISKVPS